MIDPRVRIGHVHLKVADLDRALGFWCGVLGLELTERLGDQAAFVSAGGYHHHIGLNTWDRAGARRRPRDNRPLPRCVPVSRRATLADAVRRVLAAGIPLEGASDHGVSEAIYLRDPDETASSSTATGRGQWPRRPDGELQMGTWPLDLAGPLASMPSWAMGRATQKARPPRRPTPARGARGGIDEARRAPGWRSSAHTRRSRASRDRVGSTTSIRTRCSPPAKAWGLRVERRPSVRASAIGCGGYPSHCVAKRVEQLERVIIRFAGDSGDGMQLTGDRFSSETATLGNDLATFPDYPAEIRAPAGSLPGVSGFQVHFADHDILTPGDRPDVLVAMNPAALKTNLRDLPKGGTVILNTDAFNERALQKAGVRREPARGRLARPTTTCTRSR